MTVQAGVYPQTPLGSPPVRRPDIDQLAGAAWEALRRHPGVLSLLAGGSLPGWYGLGTDAREAIREVADAVAVLLRQPGDDLIAQIAEQRRTERNQLRTQNTALTAEVERLTAVIGAARPQVTADDLAPVLYAAYIGQLAAQLPPELAGQLAGWDDLPADPAGDVALQAFTAIAGVALEQARGDYDQAAELIRLRAMAGAAEHFAGMWGELITSLPDAYTCHMACAEANAAAGLFRALGDDATADEIIAAHAEHDTEEDAHHGWAIGQPS